MARITLADVLESVNKLAERLDAIEAPAPTSTRGKSRTKKARDTRTMAERRDAGVGGVCKCGKRLATANGAAFHFGREGHDPA